MTSRVVLLMLLFVAALGSVDVSNVFYAYAVDSVRTVACRFIECCNINWQKADMGKLRASLNQYFYGQHVAKDIILNAVYQHVKNPRPEKALVMSLHGWTGTGKNYVSKFVAEALYPEGMKSKFVHQFISPIHFPHKRHIDKYKSELQTWIQGNTSKCSQSLYIFDETDKMPTGLVDAMKPYVDFHDNIDGVNHRHSIFIFLSNTGGAAIKAMAYSAWLEGMEREELQLKDMENLLQKGAFNEPGGLHRSGVVDGSLVTYYVPFLPMERKHVVQCITDYVSTRYVHPLDTSAVAEIADELIYWPEETKVYSTTGCKRVAQKVDRYMYLAGIKMKDEL